MMKLLRILVILTIASTAGALLPSNGLAAPETTPFVIYGWVDYNDGASVNDPIIVMTNASTGKTFDVETNDGSNYYQVLTDSDSVSADDVLHFRVSDGGMINTAEFDHVVSDTEIGNGGFKRNITIGAPDLIVDSITLNPNCSSAGASVFVNKTNEIRVNVRNVGVRNVTGAFDVYFDVDGEQIDCATISGGLPVDQSETITIVWTPDCTGYAPDSISTGRPITLTATADGNKDIAEENETNNGLSKEDASVYVNGFASKNFDCDADEPLAPLTGYEGVELYGGVVYNVSGTATELAAGTSVTRVHHTEIPDGMTIKAARLYLYWRDDSGTPPGSQASFDVDVAGVSYMTPDISYIDQVPYASYRNTPEGTYVYDVTTQVTGTGDYTVSTDNTQSSGKAMLYGEMLLVVYEDPAENPDNRMRLWITEGFDILNAWQCYCVSTAEATATVTFSGTIDTTDITSATLVTVVTPRRPSSSNLLINGETVVSDAWNAEAYPDSKVCVDERDISASLKASDNTIGFERNLHTPIHASNAILMVRGRPGVALPGDINGDGIVTPADAAIVLQMAVHGECSDVADVSGDGKVTSLDALMILQKSVTSEEIYVYNSSGYTGGGDLVNVAQGEVNGRVVYTVGDEPSCQYSGMTPPGGEKTVTYTGVVPKGSGNIEFARLFVYWFTWESEPVLAGMDAAFNGQSLAMAGNYSDHSGATMFDAGYGLYSYDVTKYVTKGENDATVRITSDWSVGIHAIGLLVVYEDEDEPLTKYWVNEGADIIMAENSAFPTGLFDGDCVTTAAFDDVERDDTENVNASLLTVLGFYMAYGEPSDDALEFNGHSIGSRIDTGHWKYHYRKTGIALTKNEWEDVTDHLKRGYNLAEIHSKGNYMMPNNAFLRLIFPPDLSVIDLTAPDSTVVGAHHSINVTIRNDGRSDAHDFNVTLEIDRKQMVRIPHFDLAAGENMTLHLYNWTPMLLGHVYNLTAAADILTGEDWTEIETDNNAMTTYVPIEEGGFGNQTGPRGTGGGSKPTGGEFTKKITGRVS